MNIIFRILCEDDAEAYKKIRLEALTSPDNKYLVGDIDLEKARSLNDWRIVCAEIFTKGSERAIVGAFVDNKLAGTMSACIWDKDKSRKTAYFGAAYIRPEYRCKEITQGLCQLHDKWAVERGCLQSFYMVHADKKQWIDKQIKNGATITGSTILTFANGLDALTYKLTRRLDIAFIKRQSLEPLKTKPILHLAQASGRRAKALC